MPRYRPAAAAVCLAILLMTALPAVGSAQRFVAQDSAIGQSQAMGDRLVGAFFAWGQGALGWIRALIAAEHGNIIPASPPPTVPLGSPGGPDLTAAP
jgi:hypothetical protein